MSGELGRVAWRELMTKYHLFDLLGEKWDDKKMSPSQLNDLIDGMGEADPYTYLESMAVDLIMELVEATNHFFWFGELVEQGLPYYHDEYGKVQYLTMGTLTFTQMVYFAVEKRLLLLPFSVVVRTCAHNAAYPMRM